MTNTLSDILGELQRLHEAATPAPWTSEQGYVFAQVPKGRSNGEGIARFDCYTNHAATEPIKDAALCAAMRTHLPTLLRVVPALMRVADAAKVSLALYIAMVNSGDCGNWDPETEDQVIAMRAALASLDKAMEQPQ